MLTASPDPPCLMGFARRIQSIGNETGMGVVLANLAELEFGDGQVEQALRLAGDVPEVDSRWKNQTRLALDYDSVTQPAYNV
jgi:hypothetical protein